MSKHQSKCHEASVYFRQIDGEGKPLPHCNICHTPCEVEKEKDKSSSDSEREPPFGIRRDGYGRGGHRHG